jgi:hypothetical protein
MEIMNCFTEQIHDFFKYNIKYLFTLKRNLIIVTLSEEDVYEFDRKSLIKLRIGTKEVIVNDVNKLVKLSGEESHVISLLDKSKLKELCNNKIVDFKNSSDHVLAKSSDGNIYSWGP